MAINQPKTLKERCEQAHAFQRDFDFKIPLLIDNMENRFDQLYAPWPLRFYVIHNGVIHYIAAPCGGRFDIVELRSAIFSAVQTGR